MSITAVATDAIRNYPGLYKCRLDFLYTIFGHCPSNYGINSVTGDLYEKSGLRREKHIGDKIDERESEFFKVRAQIDNVMMKMISDNAEALASISYNFSHEPRFFIPMIELPYVGDTGVRATIDMLSEDMRHGLMDVAGSIINEIDSPRRRHERAIHQEKYQRAIEVMEELTGKTKEQRDQEMADMVKKILEEDETS